MKTKQLILLAILLACGGGGGDGGMTNPPPPSGGGAQLLTLRAPGSVALGGSVTALAEATPSGNVTWTSSNTSVATVDAQGSITGRAPGQVSITAAVGGVSRAATVTVLEPWTDISVGGISACARTATRKVYCWGANGSHQLGRIEGETCTVFEGTAECSTTPREGFTATTFSRVAVGYAMTCALTDAGDPWCLGANDYGHMGTAAEQCAALSCTSTPVAIPSAAKFTRIGVGRRFACALDLVGAPWCWGVALSPAGYLGSAAAETCGAYPCHRSFKRVDGNHTFDSLHVGATFACGLKSSGDAWCWGANGAGQLGAGTRSAIDGGSMLPLAVTGGRRYVQLAVSETMACGITQAGAPWCWGGDSGTPTLTNGAPPLVSIAAGDSHACGLTAAGKIWCWGGITGAPFSVIGDGATTTRFTAVPILASHTFVQLSARRMNTCARKATGTAFCWGQGLYGQLGAFHALNDILQPVGVAGAQ